MTRTAAGDAFVGYVIPGGTAPYAGKTFQLSMWVKGNGSTALVSSVFLQENGGAYRAFGAIIPSGTVIPATWTRYSGTVTVASDLGYDLRIILRTGATIGDVISYDALMLTEGTTLYNYGDGNTDGWAWNGTSNASTSTGPLP
jgi:hypothetical protein